MASGQSATVLGYLRRFVGRPSAAEALDEQLLSRFIATREEAAFEALVLRHGPMVLGVCRRIVLNPADAEDAFQATFLVLARRAGSIRQPERLGNWLYGVANRTARAARNATRLRACREKELAEMPADQPLDEHARQELRWTLDEELVRLPEKYRLPLVMCYLEGRTKEETAKALGWPHGTVSTRLARGRELLRTRLARRNLTVPAVFLAAFLAQQSVQAAVPAALLTTTVASAILFTTTHVLATSAISAPVASLTTGVLNAMFMTKLKLTALTLLAITLLGTGASVLTYEAVAGDKREGTAGGGSGSVSVAARASTQPAAPVASPASVSQDATKDKPGPQPTKGMPAVRTSREIRQALRKPVQISEIPEGTTFREALDSLSTTHDILIRIDYADLVRSGAGDPKSVDQMTVQLRAAKRLTLSTALEELLSQIGISGISTESLAYRVKDGQIVIGPGSRLLPTEQGGTALRESVQVQSDRLPLEEALRELAEQTGANIVVDVRLKEKSMTPVSASMQHVPLETAVRLLADMADVKAVALENVLYVTTKENADKLLREQRERELSFELPPGSPLGATPGAGAAGPGTPQGSGGGIGIPGSGTRKPPL
jgi:RNA polymerase sigma factor (sigma-70 family)